MNNMTPAAYLLHGGRLFQARACTHLAHAEKHLKDRNDGSKIDPLLRQSEVDARIAELTAEVARYKAAMQSIVDDYKQAFHTDWTTAANYADIARNALKEGV